MKTFFKVANINIRCSGSNISVSGGGGSSSSSNIYKLQRICKHQTTFRNWHRRQYQQHSHQHSFSDLQTRNYQHSALNSQGSEVYKPVNSTTYLPFKAISKTKTKSLNSLLRCRCRLYHSSCTKNRVGSRGSSYDDIDGDIFLELTDSQQEFKQYLNDPKDVGSLFERHYQFMVAVGEYPLPRDERSVLQMELDLVVGKALNEILKANNLSTSPCVTPDRADLFYNVNPLQQSEKQAIRVWIRDARDRVHQVGTLMFGKSMKRCSYYTLQLCVIVNDIIARDQYMLKTNMYQYTNETSGSFKKEFAYDTEKYDVQWLKYLDQAGQFLAGQVNNVDPEEFLYLMESFNKTRILCYPLHMAYLEYLSNVTNDGFNIRRFRKIAQDISWLYACVLPQTFFCGTDNTQVFKQALTNERHRYLNYVEYPHTGTSLFHSDGPIQHADRLGAFDDHIDYTKLQNQLHMFYHNYDEVLRERIKCRYASLVDILPDYSVFYRLKIVPNGSLKWIKTLMKVTLKGYAESQLEFVKDDENVLSTNWGNIKLPDHPVGSVKSDNIRQFTLKEMVFAFYTIVKFRSNDETRVIETFAIYANKYFAAHVKELTSRELEIVVRSYAILGAAASLEMFDVIVPEMIERCRVVDNWTYGKSDMAFYDWDMEFDGKIPNNTNKEEDASGDIKDDSNPFLMKWMESLEDESNIISQVYIQQRKSQQQNLLQRNSKTLIKNIKNVNTQNADSSLPNRSRSSPNPNPNPPLNGCTRRNTVTTVYDRGDKEKLFDVDILKYDFDNVDEVGTENLLDILSISGDSGKKSSKAQQKNLTNKKQKNKEDIKVKRDMTFNILTKIFVHYSDLGLTSQRFNFEVSAVVKQYGHLMHTRHFAMLAMALAGTQKKNSMLLQDIEQHMIDRGAHELDPESTSMLCFAVGFHLMARDQKHFHRDKLLDMLITYSIRNIQYFKPLHMHNLLKGMFYSQKDAPVLFEVIAQELMKNISNCSPQLLFVIVHTFSLCNLRSKELYDKVNQAICQTNHALDGKGYWRDMTPTALNVIARQFVSVDYPIMGPLKRYKIKILLDDDEEGYYCSVK